MDAAPASLHLEGWRGQPRPGEVMRRRGAGLPPAAPVRLRQPARLGLARLGTARLGPPPFSPLEPPPPRLRLPARPESPRRRRWAARCGTLLLAELAAGQVRSRARHQPLLPSHHRPWFGCFLILFLFWGKKENTKSGSVRLL